MKDIAMDELSRKIREFCRTRDWERYHTPKNLSMSIAIESAELMEIFQWLTAEESAPNKIAQKMKSAIEDEIADIMIYSIRIAQVLDFDPLKAIEKKIEKNNLKYPVDKSKGKAGV